MKANQIVAIAILGLAGSQALAVERDTVAEEKKGALIGTVIGAAVGGPFGAGVGAIVGGGVLGKMVGLHRINDELDQELSRTEAEYRKTRLNMTREVARLEQALNRSEKAREALATAPELPIQFRTNSSAIEQHYQDQLQEIAALLADRPDVQIKLSGFADRRGSADYNQQLSEARVQEVKQYLTSHGVSVRQIAAQAYGESRPVAEEESAENNFFDRRVVMKFVPAEDSVAAR